ncbi:hypothetical protein JCM10213_003447 [Rhodosporidiobolus nylandii]
MSTTASAPSSGRSEADVGSEVDEAVVRDLVLYLLDPSSPRLRSSARSLISPSLIIDLPFLPQPPPSLSSSNASSPSPAHVASVQALSALRAPALAVDAVPGASWTAQVSRIRKADASFVLTGVETATPTQLVETWTATATWTLAVGRTPSSSQSIASPSRSLGQAALSPVTEKQPFCESQGAPRIVELVFTSKALDPAVEQKKREKEQIVSSDVDAGGDEGEGDAARLGLKTNTVAEQAVTASDTSEGSWRIVGPSRRRGSAAREAEKAKSPASDEPVQPLQLVYMRYHLPATSHPFSLPFLPRFARSVVRTAILTLIAWVLPLVFAVLHFFRLDAAHVLSTKKLHRSSSKHKHGSGKGKGRERASSVSSSGSSRKRSSSRATTAAAQLSASHIHIPTPVDTVTPGEEAALARFASLSSESDPDAAAASSSLFGGTHPQHLGRSRRWSTSTAGSSHGREPAQDKPDQAQVQPILTPLRRTTSDLAFTTLSGAQAIVRDAQDLAWAIHRGVVFLVQLLCALPLFLAHLLSSAGEEREAEARPHGTKRRPSLRPVGEAEGAGDWKRRKERLEQDVADAAPGEEQEVVLFEGEKEEKREATKSPTTPTSPTKSALSGGDGSPKHGGLLKKRVSFSTSSSLIPRPDTPLSSTSPDPFEPASSRPANTVAVHTAVFATAAAAAHQKAIELAEQYSPTSAHGVPQEAQDLPEERAIAAKEAALLSHARGLEPVFAVERRDELTTVRAEVAAAHKYPHPPPSLEQRGEEGLEKALEKKAKSDRVKGAKMVVDEEAALLASARSGQKAEMEAVKKVDEELQKKVATMWEKEKEEAGTEAAADTPPPPVARSPTKSRFSFSSAHAPRASAPEESVPLPPYLADLDDPSACPSSVVSPGIRSPLSGLAGSYIPPHAEANGKEREGLGEGARGLQEKLHALESGARRGASKGRRMVDPPMASSTEVKGVKERRDLLGKDSQGERAENGKDDPAHSSTLTSVPSADDPPATGEEEEHAGATISSPPANILSKVAYASRVEQSRNSGGSSTAATGLRPTISSPQKLAVEQIPTPAPSVTSSSAGGEGSSPKKPEHRLARKESAEEKWERLRPIGVRVSGSPAHGQKNEKDEREAMEGEDELVREFVAGVGEEGESSAAAGGKGLMESPWTSCSSITEAQIPSDGEGGRGEQVAPGEEVEGVPESARLEVPKETTGATQIGEEPHEPMPTPATGALGIATGMAEAGEVEEALAEKASVPLEDLYTPPSHPSAPSPSTSPTLSTASAFTVRNPGEETPQTSPELPRVGGKALPSALELLRSPTMEHESSNAWSSQGGPLAARSPTSAGPVHPAHGVAPPEAQGSEATSTPEQEPSPASAEETKLSAKERKKKKQRAKAKAKKVSQAGSNAGDAGAGGDAGPPSHAAAPVAAMGKEEEEVRLG